MRMNLLCIHKRISCVYTRDLLCMHNTLVHALGQGPQGVQGPGPAQRIFWFPWPWGPWPRACTRVLCMHKRSLVYTQEILLCMYNKCINVTSVAMLRSYAKLCKSMQKYAKLRKTTRNYARLRETTRHYAKLRKTMRNYVKLVSPMESYDSSTWNYPSPPHHHPGSPQSQVAF